MIKDGVKEFNWLDYINRQKEIDKIMESDSMKKLIQNISSAVYGSVDLYIHIRRALNGPIGRA